MIPAGQPPPQFGQPVPRPLGRFGCQSEAFGEVVAGGGGEGGVVEDLVPPGADQVKVGLAQSYQQVVDVFAVGAFPSGGVAQLAEVAFEGGSGRGRVDELRHAPPGVSAAVLVHHRPQVVGGETAPVGRRQQVPQRLVADETVWVKQEGDDLRRGEHNKPPRG